MAYIRDDVDWYMNQGYSESKAKEQVLMDKLMRNEDAGFCNPYKAKSYSEAESKAKRLIKKLRGYDV